MKRRSAVVSAALLALGCAGSSMTGPSDVVGVTWHAVERLGDALILRSTAGMLRFVP